MALELLGFKTGRLTVVEKGPSTAAGKVRWWCNCECGSKTLQVGSILTGGTVKSCGCWRKELGGVFNRSHGESNNPAYSSWQSMKNRCDNPSNKEFKNYGAAGISYAPEWASFVAFYTDMGDRPPGTSIDRIDNSKGYCKENCRWADAVTQSRNRRVVKLVCINGESMLLIDAVAKYGKVNYQAVATRLFRGWDVVKAITTPRLKNQPPRKK